MRYHTLGALILMIGCTGGEEDEPVPEPARTGPGSIVGRITFQGEATEMPKVDLPRPCLDLRGGTDLYQESLVVGENGAVRNVLVHIQSGLGERTFPPPEEPRTVVMKGCRFVPHVFGVRRGQEIRILNDDPFPRTVSATTRVNNAFKKKIPRQGQVLPHTFEKPEVPIVLRCEEQGWIHAYLGVLDHPFFAVTGPDGTYELKDVPPGEYTVEAWHERLGEVRRGVRVPPETAVTADFVLGEE